MKPYEPKVQLLTFTYFVPMSEFQDFNSDWTSFTS